MEGNDAIAVMAVRNAPTGGLEVRVAQDRRLDCWAARARVLTADTRPEVLARCRGITEAEVRRYLDARMTAQRGIGHWVAASREFFLQTGSLFCSRGSSGADVAPEIRFRLMSQRSQVETCPSGFARMLESEDIFCDLRAMLPFTRWSGRDGQSGETATQVFLAGVTASLGASEASPGDWLAPETLLIEWRRGHVVLDFMAYGCLRVLSDFPGVEALGAEYGD